MQNAKIVAFVTTAMSMLCAVDCATASSQGSIWAHDNLFAWCVVPFDAKKRSPEARADMLTRLGFTSFAYDWRQEDVTHFDEEIDALERHHIRLFAWWFPFDADDALARTTLETFKRHHVHPQLWVIQSLAWMPKTPEAWATLLRPGFPFPKTDADWQSLSATDKAEIQAVEARLDSGAVLPKTPEEQAQRVKKEAARIGALVKLAAPYGTPVELYNHNGWFGVEQNQLAIIDHLSESGIKSVGMVYNFSHSRDDQHDDSKSFPDLWRKIQAHVVAVNITGMHLEGAEVYPSQGDSEIDMMRTIEKSGWRGPIGLIAEKGGDAEMTLHNYLVGLDWLAAELKQPGSGGPHPFPLIQ